MKKFTFILTSMLFLLVGGVFSQTTLELTGGTNCGLPSGDHPTSGIIQFRDKGIRSCLGGSAWAASYNPGETHTFTVTLEDSGNDNCTLYLGAYSEDISSNWYGSYTPIAEQSISVPDTKTLTLTVSSSYHGVYLYSISNNTWNVNIRSITRTITTASSVDKPTITAPATYDGESTAVTITPGANNHHVKYSVTGSSSDVSDVQIDSETTIYITGSSNVTITAVGYNEGESESNTNTKTITYSNVIPSGVITVWQGEKSFTTNGDWGTNLLLDKNKFANLEVGDYIYLNCTDVDYNNNRIGFRNSSHSDDIFGEYDALTMTITDGCAKLLVSDQKLCDKFKGEDVMIKGFIFKLTSVEIHKAKTLSADADNDITKYTDMIVTVDRPFVAGTWNTVCLPFVPTADQANTLFGNDYKLAAYTGVSGTTMQFTTIDINEFEAGKPYLVKPTDGCATAAVTFNDVDITARTPQSVTHKGYNEEDYSFVGNFTQKKFTGDNECNTSRFVATGNELKKPNDNSTLKSLRCYFTVPAAAAARSLSFDIDEEGGTTSINTVQGSGVMVNGYYNLAGQRVAQPTKGLYIVNGKKVVIK